MHAVAVPEGVYWRKYSLGAACRAIPAGLPVPWL